MEHPHQLNQQPQVITREQWSHHGQPHIVTVSERTEVLKTVRVFDMSSHIPNTCLYVSTVVGTEISLGIDGFLMTPQALSLYLKTF